LAASSSFSSVSALFESATVHRALARQWSLASDPVKAKEHNEQALAEFKRLIVLFSFPQLSPLPQQAHLELAEVAALLDNEGEARKAYENLVEKYADQTYATYGKAMLASIQGRRGDAVFLLKKLREQPLHESLTERIRAQIKALEATP